MSADGRKQGGSRPSGDQGAGTPSNDLPLTRRTFVRGALAATAATALAPGIAIPAASPRALAPGQPGTVPDPLHQRPAPADRHFSSPAVEAAIARIAPAIADPELRLIFSNCLPNTLDTTVFPGTLDGQPDTYVITGDIDAMWLRDSSAQLWPYLPFCKADPALSTLIEGVIRRQARLIQLDPYANAFLRSPADKPLPWSTHDSTTMVAGVGERKWEVDSLCYPIRLAHGYWRATGNTAPFDSLWQQSASRIVRTFREQQRRHGPGPYHFQRASEIPSETLPLGGYGAPARPVGLLHSGFRPSDDACLYPLFIPANLFAASSLTQLAELASSVLHDPALANAATALSAEITAALAQHGQLTHPVHGRIWAYEVDGYGNTLSIDDANAPSLLSLAYLGCVSSDEPLYRRSRSFALSADNPYFFSGHAAEGVGSPHTGLDFIWPMSVILRALTSTSDAEIVTCLRTLRNTTAGTHFMHESFHKDDPANYTRPWFAWANTLFGELILQLAEHKPLLLTRHYG